MSVSHERDISWGDSVFTLPNDADISGSPIKVVFEENIMSHGGGYAVWHEKELRGSPVEDRLSLSNAKRRAKQLQREHGSPIVESVEVV